MRDGGWARQRKSIAAEFYTGQGDVRVGSRCSTLIRWFKDPVLDLVLHFVLKVDMAPMAIRKSAYINIGGMDETVTEPGECGIITDWDLCLSEWALRRGCLIRVGSSSRSREPYIR